MRHTSFYSILAAGAMFAAPAPVVAQQPYARLATNSAADPRPITRTLATYDFDSSFEGMPIRVTVADSAGALVAWFRPRGAGADQPMKVAVADRDILLEGQTARGPFTMVLYEQNDPAYPGTIIGTWTLADRQGELRARVVR
jgi:hypothetical protein